MHAAQLSAGSPPDPDPDPDPDPAAAAASDAFITSNVPNEATSYRGGAAKPGQAGERGSYRGGAARPGQAGERGRGGLASRPVSHG